MLDSLSPYQELQPEDQEYLKSLCKGAHGKFVEFVKNNRGNKLKDDPSTFTGDVFTGQEGLERGLVD
ncbi:MAG: S49 family peptidase [Bdellovibrionales bacterium]|nr:S49 family peptidase [Bdellovibrionales bacterium]